jgi:hypothetical protein
MVTSQSDGAGSAARGRRARIWTPIGGKAQAASAAFILRALHEDERLERAFPTSAHIGCGFDVIATALELHRSTSSLPGLTRKSIALKRTQVFSMDARVKPAHDESDSLPR